MQPLGGDRDQVGPEFTPVDLQIAAWAGQRHGVIGIEDLRGLGVSRKAVRRRVRSGLLTELFPGAYAVGHHNLTRRSLWRAAVLSCGPGAALSHRAAAELWRLIDLVPGPPHVTIPHGRTLERSGIIIHRSRTLAADGVTARHGIPVTTVARTLIDFSAQAPRYELRNAIRSARKYDRLDACLIDRMCSEHRGLKGIARLRTLINDDHGPVQETRSPLEDLFLPICRDFGIRYPLVNVPVVDYEVDCLWLPERLVVELDGYEPHSSRQSFESDRERDIRLGLAGYPVQRFTHRRLTRDRAGVASDVREMLVRLARAA